MASMTDPLSFEIWNSSSGLGGVPGASCMSGAADVPAPSALAPALLVDGPGAADEPAPVP